LNQIKNHLIFTPGIGKMLLLKNIKGELNSPGNKALEGD
jgi:hypothetical protein